VSRSSQKLSTPIRKTWSSRPKAVFCARQGIGFIPWSPLAFGELARSGGVLDRIAKQRNARPGQIALAWLLKRSSTMLPIPGTASVKHLEENILGATIKLSQEEFDLIDRASR